MPLRERIWRWLRRAPRLETPPPRARRGPLIHVVIMDGTMSSLKTGQETNAGMLYKLLCEMVPSARISLLYEAGIQWQSWNNTRDVIEGRGINRRIKRAYGFIASRYRPGDKIFLFGYSRGAYAVRSLAGAIDQVGLLKGEHATVRNIEQAYRHYRMARGGPASIAFTRRYCHLEAPVEMVGVWDTVKALGLRLPIVWRWADLEHKFHNHDLGPTIRHGYHALARDETREIYAPVLWQTHEDWKGTVEQVWFRGSHADVGGQLDGFLPARPLANIPLVWMLEKAETCGLPLPEGWRARFPIDRGAPSVGTMRGWGKLFIFRRKRTIGLDRSESLHPTVLAATSKTASGPEPAEASLPRDDDAGETA